jgi:hypothetical protein
MAFPTCLLILGLVLVGFNGHSMKAKAPAVPEAKPDETEHVVSRIDAYRRRHCRDPKIPEVQGACKGLSRTTAWRRIRTSRTQPRNFAVPGFFFALIDVPQFCTTVPL